MSEASSVFLRCALLECPAWTCQPLVSNSSIVEVGIARWITPFSVFRQSAMCSMIWLPWLLVYSTPAPLPLSCNSCLVPEPRSICRPRIYACPSLQCPNTLHTRSGLSSQRSHRRDTARIRQRTTRGRCDTPLPIQYPPRAAAQSGSARRLPLAPQYCSILPHRTPTKNPPSALRVACA